MTLIEAIKAAIKLSKNHISADHLIQNLSEQYPELSIEVWNFVVNGLSDLGVFSNRILEIYESDSSGFKCYENMPDKIVLSYVAHSNLGVIVTTQHYSIEMAEVLLTQLMVALYYVDH
jgi:hypothetical protein